jgi:uncharacterized repeat protein (TIGR01451 family)
MMNFHEQGAVMKNSIQVILMTVLMSTLLTVAANAQEQNQLDINTVVQKEQVTVNVEGESVTELVPAASVVPGERVVYTITFRNVGQDSAENVVITNPIDANLNYADGSAFGPGTVIEFSVDGGATYADASALSVTEDGVARAASATDYTNIRWTMQEDLAVGAQGVARFTAVLK